MPFLSLLTGPIGKVLGIGALALALLTGGLWVLHEHDLGVLAGARASAEAAQIVALQADQARATAALEANSRITAAAVASFTNARRAVDAAPVTTSCAGSPAIRAALGGLRDRAAANHPRAAH